MPAASPLMGTLLVRHGVTPATRVETSLDTAGTSACATAAATGTPAMITLTIDGRRVTVPPETSVLDAAKWLGIRIPTMCHVPGIEHRGLRWDRDPPAVDRQGDHGRGTCGCCRGARTPARSVESPLDASAPCGSERRHECRRGRHECLRHMWIWALMGSPPRWHRPGTPGGICRSLCGLGQTAPNP